MDENELSMRPWPLVAEQTLHETPIFSLSSSERRSPTTGRKHTFLRLDAPDWVNVIALTEGGGLILVEQYRHGTDALTLEIPGGAVDPGEEPVTAVVRELEEETGYRAGAVHLIGAVEPNPAFLSNRCWTYLVTGCSATGEVDPDPSEEITVRLSTVEGFTDLIERGEIAHSLVIAAHDHLQRGLHRDAPWSQEVRCWMRSD